MIDENSFTAFTAYERALYTYKVMTIRTTFLPYIKGEFCLCDVVFIFSISVLQKQKFQV